ncbi:MAG: ferredoxin [Actinomycetota bacterium]|jgi:ferredoxin|nr:ferredoxin [Actinomycetota bacterium]
MDMHIDERSGACVGAGQCVMNAPGVFDQGDDGLVMILNDEPTGADADAATQAVDLCPSGAISIRGE